MPEVSSVIPLVLSVALAGGVYLIYEGSPGRASGCWRRCTGMRLREFLVRAGLHDVTPRDFVLLLARPPAC